jgi:malate/lactate dehydrogenase
MIIWRTKSMARKKDGCIVTAGVARTPGMNRDDLLGVNCQIRREDPEKTF